MGPTREDVIHEFTYQTPTSVDVNKMQELRVAAKELALLMYEYCPPSPDRSVAIRKLRESIMVANASIVLARKEEK
jgi:hypothetical protein